MTSLASIPAAARASIGRNAAHFAPKGGPTGARRSNALDPNALPSLPSGGVAQATAAAGTDEVVSASVEATPGAAVDDNPVVFLDITVGGAHVGRLEIELFAGVAPRSCENFRALCVGSYGYGDSCKLHYSGCRIHRVVPGFCVQGGDLEGNNGRGGESIFGRTFPDEPFVLRHDAPGLLSMANCGPDTNGSQFFVTCAPAPHLDGKHVVFGRVVKGLGVVRAIEGAGTGNGATTSPVFVSCSGQLRGLDPVLPRAVVEREKAGGGGRGGGGADGGGGGDSSGLTKEQEAAMDAAVTKVIGPDSDSDEA